MDAERKDKKEKYQLSMSVHIPLLKFVQDTVHYPVGGSGTQSVASTDTLALQMFYH
jgi:hypothetical protein